MKTESGLRYNNMMKRSDILVFDRTAKPFLLVECKASNIQLSDETLAQALRYNKTLNAPYLMISNGLAHYILKIADGNAIKIETLPPFS